MQHLRWRLGNDAVEHTGQHDGMAQLQVGGDKSQFDGCDDAVLPRWHLEGDTHPLRRNGEMLLADYQFADGGFIRIAGSDNSDALSRAQCGGDANGVAAAAAVG